MKKSKLFYIIIFFIALVFIYILINSINLHNNEDLKKFDLKTPDGTKVILNFSTLTDTTVNINPKPFSQFYYYNSKGELLSYSEINDEIVNDFIVEGNNEIAYLLKNSTIIANEKEVVSLDSNSSVHISNINFGPSQVGYINKHNLYYSLLNIGKRKETNGVYIYTIRFVSKNENYSIDIPYYIENICYDEINDKFLCIVKELNSLDLKNFKYIEIEYNDNLNKYELNNNLKEINYNNKILNDIEENNSAFYYYMSKNGVIYNVFVELLNNNKGNLILWKIDLNTGTQNRLTLKENYDLGKLGYGVLSGSNHLPMEIVNNKLYIFTSDKEIFVIDTDDNIQKLSMPYIFKDTLSLKNIFDKDYIDEENFFGSEVKIGDDGNIYILNLFRDKKLRIHKLLDNGNYELYW